MYWDLSGVIYGISVFWIVISYPSSPAEKLEDEGYFIAKHSITTVCVLYIIYYLTTK